MTVDGLPVIVRRSQTAATRAHCNFSRLHHGCLVQIHIDRRFSLDERPASGAREAWIYFDNDSEGFAIKNARELSAQCRAIGLDVR